MNERPVSITIISWIMIVLGGITLVMLPMSLSLSASNPQLQQLMARNPMPIPVQYAMGFAGPLVMVVSGIWMLKGQNWARLLYVIWSAVGSVIGLATSPLKTMMIPGIVVFLVICLFLFLPNANRYFAAAGVEHGSQDN